MHGWAMKKLSFFKRYLFLLWLLCPLYIYAQEPIEIAINETAPPSQAIKAILTKAYARINVPVVFKPFSHKRSVAFVNEGLADAEAFRIKGIDVIYKNLVMVDVPIRQDDMHLYVQKHKAFAVNGFASIPKHYTVGYLRGVIFAERGIKNYHLKGNEFNDAEQVVMHIKMGRSDAVILGKGSVSESLFNKFDDLNVVRLEPPIYKTVLYHYLHKRNQHLIPGLQKAFQEMTESGELAEINARSYIHLNQNSTP